MKNILLIVLITMSLATNAQRYKSQKETNITKIENKVYSLHFETLMDSLLTFIHNENIRIEYQKKNSDELYIDFIVNQEQFNAYDLLMKKYGYSTSDEVNANNSEYEITRLSAEIKYLEQKHESYLIMMNKLGVKSESYLTLWNENKAIEENIFLKKQRLNKLSTYNNKYLVQLHLLDESNSPQYTEVTFVNMPGFEYSVLQVESPAEGISSQYYQGYFLKYLFTRGKSYFTLGAYKTTQAKTDSLKFAEMFLLGFGQDFYSRHLGRGSRKFFNLYSGYSIGGVLSTGVGSNYYDMYIAPSIGLEIFKNKYILLDTKLTYFVPIANNKNQRGLSLNVSFNFMF